MKLFETIKFLFKTKHLPKTYRKLFRDLSSLYLTPKSPGIATIGGRDIYCLTNGRCLLFSLKQIGQQYFIDREALTVSNDGGDTFVSLSEVPTVYILLNEMIENGIPFKMSDSNVTYLGI